LNFTNVFDGVYPLLTVFMEFSAARGIFGSPVRADAGRRSSLSFGRVGPVGHDHVGLKPYNAACGSVVTLDPSASYNERRRRIAFTGWAAHGEWAIDVPFRV
jgi:hypothetical protein